MAEPMLLPIPRVHPKTMRLRSRYGACLAQAMDGNLSKGAGLGEVVIRLLVAVLVGGLIGWDRQRAEKPAGLRTHMLVALGSASFTLLGFEVGAHLSPKTGEGFDPTRVLQGVIGGIGFLGAGAIIQDRGHVTGITTAASVWVSGALGAAAGVGAYVLAGFTTLLAFAVLRVSRFERSDSDSNVTPPGSDAFGGSEAKPPAQKSPHHPQ
jgi:putative Mg2+ transporter-C (MgtC) family protein